MENLQRRTSGIYVARLTVPARLRRLVGQRELIATTGTTQLPMAKLVAGMLLARWRQQLLDLDRIALAGRCMDHDSVIKIADGSPLLAADTHLPIEQAAAVMGLQVSDLLRRASDRRLRLFHRFLSTLGYLLPSTALEIDDAELGTRLVPNAHHMLDSAVRHEAAGIRPLLENVSMNVNLFRAPLRHTIAVDPALLLPIVMIDTFRFFPRAAYPSRRTQVDAGVLARYYP